MIRQKKTLPSYQGVVVTQDETNRDTRLMFPRGSAPNLSNYIMTIQQVGALDINGKTHRCVWSSANAPRLWVIHAEIDLGDDNPFLKEAKAC